MQELGIDFLQAGSKSKKVTLLRVILVPRGNYGGKGIGKVAGFNFFMKDGLGNPHRQAFSFAGDL